MWLSETFNVIVGLFLRMTQTWRTC